MTPIAYHRTVALAHACGLDWAAWALGLTAPRQACPKCGGVGNIITDRGQPQCMACAHSPPSLGSSGEAPPIPVPERIKDLHAPYLADCERRGVQPGEMPAMDWHSAAWVVSTGGSKMLTRCTVEDVTAVQVDQGSWQCSGNATAADLARLAELVTAVEKADTRTP